MPHSPVLTIDGPSGSGKGTVAKLLAQALRWHYLDSGAIYRVLAYAARDIDLTDEVALAAIAKQLDLTFLLTDNHLTVNLAGKDITQRIRSELIGSAASKIASLPLVRAALLDRQRAFRQSPGLVADGRDMGTVVFPSADYKVFLTASVKIRAERRYKQLKENGIESNLSNIIADISKRDARDSQRRVAPLLAADNALALDSSNMGVQAVFKRIYAFVMH